MINLYHQWLRNSGLVKKLHFVIFILFVFVLCLILQIVNLNKELYRLRQGSTETRTNDKLAEVSKSKENIIDLSFEPHSFVKIYLENFFGTNNQNIEFIGKHTKTELYVDRIYPEMNNRQKLSLQSQFKLKNLISEGIEQNQVKFICFGQEIFLNQEYEDRSFTIELILDLESKKIIAIPVFKIE